MAEKLKCEFCGSTDIDTHYHIGWDVCEEGEEDQDLNTCNTCGAECYSFTLYHFSGEKEHWNGNWLKDGKLKKELD